MIVQSLIARFLSFCFLFTLLVSVPSCNKEESFDCIKSTGPIIVQKRPISAFSEIILNDNIDLYLTNTDRQEVIIEAGKNIINKIQVVNLGQSLIISNKNTCNWVRSYKRPIKVTIGVRQSELIIMHKGYGEIKSAEQLNHTYLGIQSYDTGGNITINTNTESLNVYSNSIAHITVSGYTNEANIWLNGAIGRVSAQSLEAKRCLVKHSGSNEIRVYPIEELQATITRNGIVAYYNEPIKLSSTIKSNGKLLKR